MPSSSRRSLTSPQCQDIDKPESNAKTTANKRSSAAEPAADSDDGSVFEVRPFSTAAVPSKARRKLEKGEGSSSGSNAAASKPKPARKRDREVKAESSDEYEPSGEEEEEDEEDDDEDDEYEEPATKQRGRGGKAAVKSAAKGGKAAAKAPAKAAIPALSTAQGKKPMRVVAKAEEEAEAE